MPWLYSAGRNKPLYRALQLTRSETGLDATAYVSIQKLGGCAPLSVPIALHVPIDVTIYMALKEMLNYFLLNYSESSFQNFRRALEEELKVPLYHRSHLNISFQSHRAQVDYTSVLKGWEIVPEISPCHVSSTYKYIVYITCNKDFLNTTDHV